MVNAATAALFLYINGHGSAIFRDGLRLVLITFLLSSALWAQVSFIATVIDTTDSTMPCQAGIIFSTLFDQVGRFSVEQYLLWAMNTGRKQSIADMIAQALVAGRFVVGMVFVGFSKPQVDTVCVASSSSLPIAITTIALDAVIIAMFAARAFMTRMVADIQENTSSAARSKSVLLVMVGFAIWTGVSDCRQKQHEGLREIHADKIIDKCCDDAGHARDGYHRQDYRSGRRSLYSHSYVLNC